MRRLAARRRSLRHARAARDPHPTLQVALRAPAEVLTRAGAIGARPNVAPSILFRNDVRHPRLARPIHAPECATVCRTKRALRASWNRSEEHTSELQSLMR